MKDFKYPAPASRSLMEFHKIYSSSKSEQEKDKLWENIRTPFIEEIPDDSDHHLVTFLYRQPQVNSEKQLFIYLQCDAIGLQFSEKSLLKSIPDTDICFLSLVLPSTLRITYTFLKVKNLSFDAPKENEVHPLFPYPKFIDKVKSIFELVSKLYEENNVEIDDRNPQKISYPAYDDTSVCFATESIFELPFAPKEDKDFFDIQLIKKHHAQLMKKKRLTENKVNIYQEERKYWIYLPENDQKNSDKNYPLLVFLDGSDYLSNIPALSILETMITEKNFPPCIAVFLDYSEDRRLLEYYCDEKFTDFLAHDFIDLLKTKYHLPISNDPKQTAIVGSSASGLAALFAGLKYPDIFGNVITQSAALWSVKQQDMEKWVDEYLSTKKESYFFMEAGIYENVPLSCEFMNGDKQSVSINQSNKEIVKYMIKKGIKASFSEFVGGHNYVCWRNTLFSRFRDLAKAINRG